MRSLATCLLLIYLSISCRPVVPVLADGLAHLLWYDQHIATVHFHDGYAHMHNEIANIVEEETGEKNTTSLPAKTCKLSDFLAAHLIAEIRLDNIPCWDIWRVPSFGNTHVLVGLYSKKVPDPPPDGLFPTPNREFHHSQHFSRHLSSQESFQCLCNLSDKNSLSVFEPVTHMLSFFSPIFSQLLYENFPLPTTALGSAFYAHAAGFYLLAGIFTP